MGNTASIPGRVWHRFSAKTKARIWFMKSEN